MPRADPGVSHGIAAKVVGGSELSAVTGSMTRETQVAWARKAPRNLGGEVRILSKRESLPSSLVMREKRNEPTRRALSVTGMVLDLVRDLLTSACP